MPLPPITRDAVRAWTDPQSFERGQRYAAQGAIFDARVQERMLKGSCHGSSGGPYRLHVTLSEDGIASGDCSCPVGGGGHCKHVVALLLTWLRDPNTFVEVEALNEALDHRTADELKALIRSMVQLHPDLERLVTMPSGRRSGQRLDPELIRDQVGRLVQDAQYEGYSWGDGIDLALRLKEMATGGDRYAEAGDWMNAAAVYSGIALEVMEQIDQIYDEVGETGRVAGECVSKLADLAPHLEDAREREEVLDALAEAYLADVASGGYGIGSDVPERLAEHATLDERRRLAEQVQSRLDRVYDDWRQRAYGNFLLTLLHDDLDDDEYLAICWESGLTADLVERLLALGRGEEAFKAVTKISDYELSKLLPLFEHTDLLGKLREHVARRLKFNDGPHASTLRTWLRDAYRADAPEAALVLSRDLFWSSRTVAAYEELRRDAEAVERWDEERASLMEQLRQNENYALLARIHLAEDEVQEALETVQRTSDTMWRYSPDASLKLEVAQAAEKKHPEAAVALYRPRIDRLINERGRSNYAEAVGLLVRVRRLYERQGQSDAWQALIRHIHREHNRLPALRDELKKVGL